MRTSALLTILLAAVVSAHSVITYPGWRGNNLITNATFPYGMQWIYPFSPGGGHNVTTNRTYWPTKGGAIAFQPGWFRGHQTAFAYVNMGFGDDGPDGGPANMTQPIVPMFQILGPTNNPFPGTICLPQVPLPHNVTVKAGDKATIQVVELAIHGAALYSCVDIIFADPGDKRLAEVNETNCFNSTDIGFADVYTITTKASGSDEYASKSGATRALRQLGWAGWLPLAAAGAIALLA
ncbi:gpi anchored protein [Fusarium austroafricanum]|uniref:Gpi anchored protein n=1 Tax=Fusarium austroafricanum TaxID=2364996 RepID=A0A8H4KDD2_9HYPO|nr:gpi anchored protein [Fusarium austroafricanum]